MPSSVEDQFLELATELSRVVAKGHDENAGEIVDLMPQFAQQDLAFRYFLHKCCSKPQFQKLISAQSFFVYGCNEYYIRVNAWYPRNTKVDEKTRRLLDEYYSVDKCHNHSYDFFTVGLMGPGYISDFRRSKEDALDKSIGDRIEFASKWTDQLDRGKSFYVKKDVIFHTQFVPEAYSSSLNLVIRKRADCKQYVLGDDSETVCEVFDFRGDDRFFNDEKWREDSTPVPSL